MNGTDSDVRRPSLLKTEETTMTTTKHTPSSPTPLLLRRASGTTRTAFTVIELLVAIGAVAIVSIGLAAIFDAIGKTVQGGRRVSVLTQYAAMIENQLRKDIGSIDPNSFMMIRQQFVDVGNDGVINASDIVPLFAGQAQGDQRQRRIDEMVFFASGDFASMRPPIAYDRPTKSRQARIYYGHGEKMTPNYAGGNPGDDYFFPTFVFRDAPGNEQAATLAMPRLGITIGVGNPAPVATTNNFASEWTLLRHQTLLVPPTATRLPPVNLATLGIAPPGRALDGDAQIDLQPAAASIFRTVNFRMPSEFRADSFAWIADGENRPSFATGMVDVATTDLDEIRSHILSIATLPDKVVLTPADLANLKPFDFAEYRWGTRPGVTAETFDALERMQTWMSDAFPTQSLSVAPDPYTSDFLSDFSWDPAGRRIRYEAQPIGMRETLEASGADPLGEAYRRANQVMLTAHNFVPRCTEFIVEWSFGRTNPTTQSLIWHGPPRPGISNQELCFYPYPDLLPNTMMPEGKSFRFVYTDPVTNEQKERDEVFVFTDRLIYGESPDRVNTPSAVTSYFGYIDPTFNPGKPLEDNPGTPEDESRGFSKTSELMEWPRPKLIRVTLSIADPQDPSKEETFQFVFDVPQTRAR